MAGRRFRGRIWLQGNINFRRKSGVLWKENRNRFCKPFRVLLLACSFSYNSESMSVFVIRENRLAWGSR
jgi:hypothetical protein